MRISSGVPGFDALIQGGFPSGAGVVVQGPAGKEKDMFLLQFVAEGLRTGGAALIVLSSISPSRYQQELRDAGVDVDAALAENRLKFVDWFTYKEQAVQDVEQDGPTFRASIDLANVGIAISRAIASLPREGEKRAAAEILSPALSVYDLPAVYGFAQSTKAKLERFGFTSLFVLEEEMHDDRTLSSLHQPFDGVVDIERVREGDEIVRRVAVPSLKGTVSESKYVLLEIGTDQILRVSTLTERERTLRRQEELIKSNPKDAKIWLATARNLRAMGESARALKCVEAALNIDAGDQEAWRFKAELLDALGRGAEAQQARATASAPVAPTKKDDAATRLLAVADQRLRQNPGDADALFVKAAALAKMDDTPNAIAALESLAFVDDAYPGLWVLKAKLHARRGEREKAQEARLRAQEVEKRQERLARAKESGVPSKPEAAFECPECGAIVGERDTMCPSCGVLFESAEEPPARELPPPKPKPEIARRGLTNGLARESPRGIGRTNGLVNGTRGRTNGLVNGTRGRTNGLVNGTRGRTNGLVNGTRGRTNGVTNGLVNGLLSLRSGMTNGLTNGSGFTNGLGSARLKQEAKVRRWKIHAIPAVLVGLLLIPLLGPGSTDDYRPITIDGQFSDWGPYPLAGVSPQAGLAANVDLVRFGVADNVDFLAFYVEVNGTALMGGGSPPTMDTIRAFLDIDRDPATGYSAAGLGADRLIEISGYNGDVDVGTLWEWDTNRDARDWSGWIKGASVFAAASGARVEAMIDWNALVGQKQPIDVAFHAAGYDGSTDIADYAVSTTAGSLRIVETPVPPETVVGANVQLARLDLQAAVRSVSYDQLDVMLIGTASVSAVSVVRLVDGSGFELGARIPVSPQVSFQFAPRALQPGQTERLFVVVDTVGATGETLGARIAQPGAVRAGPAAVSLARVASPRAVGYLGTIPTSAVVDGAFSEWTAVRTDVTGEPSVPDSIDVAEYAYYLNALRASAYVRVNGRMLDGALVPVAPPLAPTPGPPGPSEPDSDRDGVPNLPDLFPNDFNNDGIDDALTANDYDGDGVIDYPAGPDLFLNTTIPGSFPVPYANRPISIYIGPRTTPAVLGEDAARVFLDADNDTATGFRVDAIGADYLAEIRGKYGDVTSRTLSAFTGTSQLEWSWTLLETVPAATDSARLELSFDVSARGFINESRAFFDLRDWSGKTDAGQPPIIRVDTRGAYWPTTRDISGNQKWFFRDTSTTGTGCTTNLAASTTAGSAATSTALSSSQSICWFTTLGQPSPTVAGSWEVILDIDKTTDGTRVASPNANGDTNAWSAAGCAEANEYQCVDESTNNGDTDYIVSNATTTTDSLYNFADWSSPPSPLSIVNVIVEASCRKTGNPGVDSRVIVKSGSTTGVGSTATNCPNSGTYVVWSDTWTTDPADGAAWTLTDVDALQIGVRDNDATNRELRVSHVKVTVTYVPVYSVEIDKCTNEACTSYLSLYGPTNGNSYGSDVTFTTGSISGQTLGASERFRFKITLETTGSVTVRYNGANPGTDDSRATIPIPEFEHVAMPIGIALTLAWVVRRNRCRRRTREAVA